MYLASTSPDRRRRLVKIRFGWFPLERLGAGHEVGEGVLEGGLFLPPRSGRSRAGTAGRGVPQGWVHALPAGGGGPAFVDRGLHFEFAGIIYQHSPEFDILFLRPAGPIREDGSIQETL